MARPIKTGRILSTGVITAEEQRAAIGVTEQPRQGRVPLSPAQQRRVENDEWPGEPPEGFEVNILSPADVYDLWGRPELSAAPNSPDGAPVPIPPPPNTTRRPTDWEAIDGEQSTQSRTDAAQREAARLKSDFRKHAEAVAGRAAMAKGSPSREAAAIEEIRKTRELGERIRDEFGSL